MTPFEKRDAKDVWNFILEKNNLITRSRKKFFVSLEASSSLRMPRQKSAPKRSGIDLGLLLNSNNENTNNPGRGGEGGGGKTINHEAVAKLFLSVKNKEEEEEKEEEEKNATKTPTVTNFNDVLDDDEKVEDQNTNNVLRLVKTLENSHEATRWRRRWA